MCEDIDRPMKQRRLMCSELSSELSPFAFDCMSQALPFTTSVTVFDFSNLRKSLPENSTSTFTFETMLSSLPLCESAQNLNTQPFRNINSIQSIFLPVVPLIPRNFITSCSNIDEININNTSHDQKILSIACEPGLLEDSEENIFLMRKRGR